MPRRTSVTPDIEGLRALSHPGRLRMLGLLRSNGPATATALAARLGLNSGATSYHLRQLEKHGFVAEDVERGTRRERWWRAVHGVTQSSLDVPRTPAEQDSYDAYLQSIVIVYADMLQRSVEERQLLPPAWQDAGTLSDWKLRLTPERAKELRMRMSAIVDEYEEDDAETPDTALFTVNLNAFVRPGTLVEDPDGPDSTDAS